MKKFCLLQTYKVMTAILAYFAVKEYPFCFKDKSKFIQRCKNVLKLRVNILKKKHIFVLIKMHSWFLISQNITLQVLEMHILNKGNWL